MLEENLYHSVNLNDDYVTYIDLLKTTYSVSVSPLFHRSTSLLLLCRNISLCDITHYSPTTLV